MSIFENVTPLIFGQHGLHGDAGDEQRFQRTGFICFGRFASKHERWIQPGVIERSGFFDVECDDCQQHPRGNLHFNDQGNQCSLRYQHHGFFDCVIAAVPAKNRRGEVEWGQVCVPRDERRAGFALLCSGLDESPDALDSMDDSFHQSF